VKSGIYSVKRVLISENMNVVMKDNRYINKLSKIKSLVEEHYPNLYKKHILKNVLGPNIHVRRIINWPLLISELDENGYLEKDPIFRE
tara:strand:- start:678 stop:941 length:264 start_codon:yes stop_codon:yes gene_type:complete